MQDAVPHLTAFKPTTTKGLSGVLGSQSANVIHLFCIPYAGGSAAVYRDWQNQAPRWLEIHPIELPGRGRLSSVALPQSIPQLAQQITSSLDAEGDAPFALFGHSMGAAIAYEVARNLEIRGSKLLRRLIVSGARAPFLPRMSSGTSDLTDLEFLDLLRDLNGTPPDVLDDAELMEVLLPIIRSDFAISEKYFLKKKHVLQIPITVLAGDGDPYISVDDAEAWGKLTVAPLRIVRFPGDHFFIASDEASVIAAVSRDLCMTVE
jgi:surfactin synthase thioesterase subunit